MLSVATGLELEQTYERIVEAATDLVGARYGALGVLAPDGTLSQFIHCGMEPGAVDRIGALPTGCGILGIVFSNDAPMRMHDLTQHPAHVSFPAHHPRMTTFLGVPLRVRGQLFGHLYLTEKHDEGGFTADDEVLVHALATAAGIAIENARLYEAVRQRQRWLEVSGEITIEILDGTTTDDSLRLIAERALELIGADQTAILLPDPPENACSAKHLVIAMSVGKDGDAVIGRIVPVAGSTTGMVFSDGVPRSVPRLTYDVGVGESKIFGPAMAVPLRTGDTISGVLLAVRAPSSELFNPEQLQIAASFAVQAALALQRAQSQAQRQEASVIAVREQIARDLHDQVIQRLFAIGLAMQGTQRRTASIEVSQRLDEHIDRLQEVIADIRGTIFDLEIDSAQPPKLRVVLNKAVIELTENSGVLPTVLISGPIGIVSAGLRSDAQAVVREAVSNVVRHARASSVTVSIKVADELIINVRDNGIGIPASSTPRGLKNLEYRAKEAGGSFSIGNHPDGGTELTWQAPFV
ncbi:GAF domain-containing protein [Nakamurella antarctica]|uniref:GAF domain-containing protein n=1 Tax=Nakamurella antarctica TaxID=1902245 RepID=A0A3G8ZT23_9ACTN|nr:GAF domain-containing protein [Nakamurella antarctica]AZI57206.1 GAF domain-containing protein [Nakamurella antarctica]